MSSVTDECFMCTNNYDCSIVDDGIVTQVEYLMPEITVIKLGVPLRICCTCEEKLNSFKEFKQSCVTNSMRLEAKIKESQQNSCSRKKESTAVATNSTYVEDITIKEEPSDEIPYEREYYKIAIPGTSDQFEEIYIKNEEIGESSMDFEDCTDIYENKTKEDPIIEKNVNSTNSTKDNQAAISKSGTSNAIMEDELNCTPPELRNQTTTNDILPKKSRDIYEKEFTNFEIWCTQNNVQDVSEDALIAYFDVQSKKKKSSTLWSIYSMLKSCLKFYKNVDISKYAELNAFLKRLGEGYEPKKSQILEVEDINRFIKEADDNKYLALKIVLIMGYNGACSREELTNMSIDDIEYKTDTVLVSIPKTKHNIQRLFAIRDELWINLIKKYVSLRPSTITHRRFFVTYRNGYCVSSPIGINTIGKIPRTIATYLKVPNPELYTGHCFRRSSATYLGNRGGDVVTIKRHSGWKSSAIAEGYVTASVKRKISSKIDVAHMLLSQSSANTQM